MTQVLVIGAGHTGLVAAIHLAAAGLDVCVLEHAPRPGGGSSSVECTLPGFVHDHCSGFVPMTFASPAMRELELDVEWAVPDVVMAHPFPDGSAVALHRDVGETVASLGAAGEGWSAAMEQLLPRASTLAAAVLAPLPPVRAPLRLAAGLRRSGLEWTRRLLGSVEALGLDLFSGDRRATAWLAGSAQHSGLPPTAAASGAFGFLLQLLGHRYGWPLPVGGMQSLADALVRRASGHGAVVRCSASVSAVIVRGGRVAGVRLADGSEVAADAVVSTVSAGALARLLPPGALPGRLERRLRLWRYGTAPFKLDYALSGPVPWTAPEARSAGVVHVAGELPEFALAADEANRGVVPDRPALVVGQQSLFDRTRVPAGGEARGAADPAAGSPRARAAGAADPAAGSPRARAAGAPRELGAQTLYVYGHVPARYELSDEAVAERLEAQLERFAPGFSSLVLGRSRRAPWQTERENPSMVGGDLAGGSYELDQQLIFRPAPELCRYRTPLRGLYMAGASVHPGGAVHGVSGRGAARALLFDRRLRRL